MHIRSACTNHVSQLNNENDQWGTFLTAGQVVNYNIRVKEHWQTGIDKLIIYIL